MFLAIAPFLRPPVLEVENLRGDVRRDVLGVGFRDIVAERSAIKSFLDESVSRLLPFFAAGFYAVAKFWMGEAPAEVCGAVNGKDGE